MKAVAVADLGGLGAKNGEPVAITWTMGNVAQPFLAWLVVLAVLFAPMNRHASAWWIWAPLLGLLLLINSLQPLLTDIPSEVLDVYAQTAQALAFAAAVFWLLAPLVAARKVLLFLGAFPGISVVTLAFYLLANGLGQDTDLLLCPLFVGGISGLALALALVCRRRTQSPWRFTCLLPVWILVTWLAVLFPFFIPAMMDGVPLREFGIVIALAAGCTAVVLMPFVVLGMIEPFYRARLRKVLQLVPAPAGATPAHTPDTASV